jgi:hypothetical protein
MFAEKGALLLAWTGKKSYSHGPLTQGMAERL